MAGVLLVGVEWAAAEPPTTTTEAPTTTTEAPTTTVPATTTTTTPAPGEDPARTEAIDMAIILGSFGIGALSGRALWWN